METVAFAREPEQLSNMNPSQVTGAASSYARKYALCGLLAIDDSVDADSAAGEPEQTLDDVLAALRGVKSRAEFEKVFIETRGKWSNNPTFMATAKEVAKIYPKAN